MSPLEIRPIAPAEVPAAVELLAFLNPDKPPELVRSRLDAILRDHPHYLPIGAFIDGDMKGFVGAWIATRIWSGRYLEVDNFVVHPDQRGAGIGTRLMAHLEDLARANDCEIVALDTYVTLHDAHRLYHRLGYSVLGYHFVKKLGPSEA